jgi:hypothetical protein
MGCEGDKNLDNDAAADFLADLSDELFQRVKVLMEHPHGHEYDDELIAELFVRIEMIFALHDRGMIRKAPEQGEIGRLIDPYITRWEAYHRSAGHEIPQERRGTIVKAFGQLLTVIREVHDHKFVITPIEHSDSQIISDVEIFARWDSPSKT